MSKNEQGDIDVLVLKFAHILRKNLNVRYGALGRKVEETKSMTLKADMIQSRFILSAVIKSIDEAINEFRRDAENAGALYPKRRAKPRKTTSEQSAGVAMA